MSDTDKRFDRGGIVFLWEKTKADEVFRRRGISLKEAASIVFDPLHLTEPDESYGDRGRYIGFTTQTENPRLLLVVHVRPEGQRVLRIITSWPATREEARRYREQHSPTEGIERRERRRRSRDPSSRRPTFLEFSHRNGLLGEKGRLSRPMRSQVAGNIGRMQEKGWAMDRAAALPTAGARVRAARQIWGWTQAELARRAGIDQPTLSRIEKGTSVLGLKRAEALAKAMHIEPSMLLWKVARKRRSRSSSRS